jgi:TonB family protein
MRGNANLRFGLKGMAVVLILCGLAVAESQEQSTPPIPKDTVTQAEIPQHVRVSSGVVAGLLIKKVNPKYPGKARQKGVQGTVILRAMINKDGDIADLQLISGDPLLAKAAMDAVKKWKYWPYIFQGQPVEVDTQIQVNFTLSN